MMANFKFAEIPLVCNCFISLLTSDGINYEMAGRNISMLKVD